MPFEALDFYRIDDLLAPEERIVRDTVREFVDKEFLPIVVEHFRRDHSVFVEASGYPLTESQIVAALLLAVAVPGFVYVSLRGRRLEELRPVDPAPDPA